MWLMDDVTLWDVRARDSRILQINSQNFTVRKTWFLGMGAFSWQNATYTIQFIYINSEKLLLPGRCAPVQFFGWKCGKLRKTAKSGYPALIWPFRTSLFKALSWNKISHMKIQSLKMFKTTKDTFYKQLDVVVFFFYELIGPIMGLREPCLFIYLSIRFVGINMLTFKHPILERTLQIDHKQG